MGLRPNIIVPNLPSMFTFPNMQLFYRDWAIGLCSKGVAIRLNIEVTKIVRRDRRGVAVVAMLANKRYWKW